MGKVVFTKELDPLVKINSETLGGVKKIVFDKTNEYTDISQLLTDEPAYRAVKTKYLITIALDRIDDDPEYIFDNIDTLKFTCGYVTDTYHNCRVIKLENTVTPNESVYTAVIEAEKRN